MCGPAIPLILAAAAAAVSATSQFQQSRAQTKQYQREATVARKQAAFEAQRQQRDIERKLGALHAGSGASGTLSGSGSPLDLAASFAAEAQLEPFETIRHGLIQFQDARFAAKRTKSAAGASLLSDTLQIGSQVTGAFTGPTGN